LALLVVAKSLGALNGGKSIIELLLAAQDVLQRATVFGRSFYWIAPSAMQRSRYLTELSCRESGYSFFTAGDLLLAQSLTSEK
jgi:hypothetical protein